MKSRVPARVVLAEDHRQVRRQPMALIERNEGALVYGEAESAESVQTKIVHALPSLEVLDLLVNDFNVLKKLQSFDPAAPVWVLSIHEGSLFKERSQPVVATQAAVHKFFARPLTIISTK